jgi:hypothetical protein
MDLRPSLRISWHGERDARKIGVVKQFIVNQCEPPYTMVDERQ